MHHRKSSIWIFAVLLSAVTVMLCSSALGIGRYAAVQVQVSSSEKLSDRSCRFTVPIPEEAPEEPMTLCFGSYNSIVRVFCGEDLLLTDGAERAASRRPIGHLLVTVPIPDNAWGNALTIIAEVQGSTGPASLSFPILLPASEARVYPLLNNQFDFLIFLPVTLISLAFTPVFAFLLVFRFPFGKRGFCLSLFLFLTGCWYLGYQGIPWIFSENAVLCANMEYYALFLMPIPFLGYLRQEYLPQRGKAVLLGMELLFILMAAAAAVLTLLPGSYSYLNLVFYLRILILLALCVCLYIILRARGQNRRIHERVLRSGLIVTMVLAALETARIALHIEIRGHLNLSRLLLLVFLSTLFASFLLREYRSLRTRLEREQLQRLAFTDILTGIPNRQALEQHTDEMSVQEMEKSAVLFFDANGLKKANDEFGHEAGDTLLREVAHALERAMERHSGFYGRYGGDEFMACVPASQAEEARLHFYQELERANAKHPLPFPISVACGIAAYADFSGAADMGKMIRLADDRMYRNKQEMKAGRSL